MLDLEPIKARHNATTGAIWSPSVRHPEDLELYATHWDGSREYIGKFYRLRDITFVSAAKQDVPALIAEVERLRERVLVLEASHIPQIAPTELPKYYTTMGGMGDTE